VPLDVQVASFGMDACKRANNVSSETEKKIPTSFTGEDTGSVNGGTGEDTGSVNGGTTGVVAPLTDLELCDF
jgi:hypothetical protein